MQYLNLLINSLGMASFFVGLWLLVVFFSDQLYYYEHEYSTKEHLDVFLPICGFIITVIMSFADIAYYYSEWYRIHFQWIMAVPLLICLCIFFVALIQSYEETIKGTSLWIAMLSLFFLGSSLAGQIASQNYSPKQGCLYLISFNIFWWAGVIVFSNCIMYWRAKIISKYLEEIISGSRHESGMVYFSLENEKKALKFSKFIPECESVAIVGREVRVSRGCGDSKVRIGTIDFERSI